MRALWLWGKRSAKIAMMVGISRGNNTGNFTIQQEKTTRILFLTPNLLSFPIHSCLQKIRQNKIIFPLR